MAAIHSIGVSDAFIDTDDVEASPAFHRDVLHEPAHQVDGVRDCAFRDPSDTMIRFTSERQQG